MPSHARKRPARTRRFSSGCRLRARLKRARREAARATRPSTPATGTDPQRDWSSVRPEMYRDATTPAGIASTPSAPKKTATRAAALLLLIRPPCGSRTDRPADHAGDRDQRQHVRQCREERPPLVAVGVGQPVGERAREPEEERCAPRRERPPLAEDERGEADEALPVRHALVERVHEAERDVCAAH